MVTPGADGRFYRPCPKCHQMQSYKSRSYAERMDKIKGVCKTCARGTRVKEKCTGHYQGVLSKAFFRRYRYGAKARSIDFTIDGDYAAKLLIEQGHRCALSGAKISAMDGKRNTASMDRIDNDKGYVKGNIQWVLSMINMCKHHYTQEEFIEMCKEVARASGEK